MSAAVIITINTFSLTSDSIVTLLVLSNKTFLLIQTTFDSNTVLLLKTCQDLRGFRVSQVTGIFLNNYGLDGVIVRDNDKAL